MNRNQKKLLKKCKFASILDELPIFDMIYVLPTNIKHFSGYKIMYIIGWSKKENEYYLFDRICDVLEFENFKGNIKDLHLDIKEKGIIRYWSDNQRFKVFSRVSCCSFEMVRKYKGRKKVNE